MATTLIIGAGAAGLMAGRELAKAGNSVILLEARDHIGGRIHGHTGAEFIHGDLPVTLGLLQEANISYHEVGGSLWQSVNGQLSVVEGWQIPQWPVFVQALKKLEKDLPLQQFLDEYFSGDQYAELRDTVIRYASGYDTANPRDASTLAMREEWLSEKDAPQYRINGGYDRLVTFLGEEITAAGGIITCASPVRSLSWQPGQVAAATIDGRRFNAEQAIITLPLGVLQNGGLSFIPALPAQEKAIQQIGMGGVTKVLLYFREAFWETHTVGGASTQNGQDLGMIFSKEKVPTWWTQYPERSNLLTGWIGGPAAKALKEATKEHIQEISIASLSAIFDMPVNSLQSKLERSEIINWTADPYTLGSYTYPTVYTKDALPVLTSPVDNTIYFAGEGLYEGAEMGTVEAALTSGKAAAALVINKHYYPLKSNN